MLFQFINSRGIDFRCMRVWYNGIFFLYIYILIGKRIRRLCLIHLLQVQVGDKELTTVRVFRTPCLTRVCLCTFIPFIIPRYRVRVSTTRCFRVSGSNILRTVQNLHHNRYIFGTGSRKLYRLAEGSKTDIGGCGAAFITTAFQQNRIR